MDFQFWIWLIVIVLTLIARANKKKPGQPPVPEDIDDDAPRRSHPSPQPKAITFEDLLREIQGEKALAKPVPPPKPEKKEYEFVDYDDDIPDEIQEFEKEVKYDASNDERAFQAYEASKKEAKTALAIEKEAKVGKIERSEHFKGYSVNKKVKPSFDFLNELRDPKGFKKAFIMSEILNTKY